MKQSSSMSNLRVIGKGRVAQIVTDDVWAYKLYPSWYPIEGIIKEAHILTQIYTKTQLKSVTCEVLKDEHALKMSLIHGKTIADMMRKEKFKEGIQCLIQTQVEVFQYHDLDCEDAFTAFESTLKHSSLQQEVKDKALQSLSMIERKYHLCHFDMHLENIMMTDEGLVILDWMNAKLGNPTMDIARSYIILSQYVKRQANPYLKQICQRLSIDIDDVLKAVPLMAALRMLEEESPQFKDQLSKLIHES